jgi:hypothetical protein
VYEQGLPIFVHQLKIYNIYVDQNIPDPNMRYTPPDTNIAEAIMINTTRHSACVPSRTMPLIITGPRTPPTTDEMRNTLANIPVNAGATVTIDVRKPGTKSAVNENAPHMYIIAYVRSLHDASDARTRQIDEPMHPVF